MMVNGQEVPWTVGNQARAVVENMGTVGNAVIDYGKSVVNNIKEDATLAREGTAVATSSKTTIPQKIEGAAVAVAAVADIATAVAPESDVESTVGHSIENSARGTAAQSENIVYRALRKDEDPTKGLSARSPGAGTSVGSHVNGKIDSSIISTSKDINKVLPGGKFNKDGNTVVAIDLNKVDAQVTDASNGVGKGQVYSRTKSDQEVLIHHEDASKPAVPPEAIQVIQPPPNK